MQRITVTGRLGDKPTLRYTSSGQEVYNFSIAENGDQPTNSSVTWFPCVAWGPKPGETSKLSKIIKDLSKGQLVRVDLIYKNKDYTKHIKTKTKEVIPIKINGSEFTINSLKVLSCQTPSLKSAENPAR
jgi:single-stranded DNA-binding protein